MSHKRQIFKLNNLKKLLTEENSCVSLAPTSRLLALPPFFLNNMKSGILYMLNSMLKKYDRTLGGIVIGYQNIKVLMDENTGIIPIGTSEIEVNISVEFYIFQPKIGNYLEGIINKKSNNHIGCLVHRYFNATILKPDNVDYEDWICKDFNVDDKIIFKVIDLDFTSLLPYIEGIIDSETLLDEMKFNISKNCDAKSLIVNNVNMYSFNMISPADGFLKNKLPLDKESEDFFENVEGSKNVKISTFEDNVNINLERNESFTNSKKKKKKKDKKELPNLVDCKLEKKKISVDEKVKSNIEVFSMCESHSEKKKKKKEDNADKDIQKDSVSVDTAAKEENQIDLNCRTLEKFVQIKNQNLRDFVKLHKKKKEKKRKKNEKEELINFSQVIQGLSSKEVEDNILYSTLLDHSQPKKMRIPFCSPIPQGTPRTEKSLTHGRLKNQNETAKKEKKKKLKKRKREEEKQALIFPDSKKIKKDSSFRKEFTKDEPDNDKEKSELQNITEELYKQQLKRVKEAFNISDKDSCMEEKKKKGKFKKLEKELSDSDRNVTVQLNGRSSAEKKSETQSLLNKLYKQELQRVKDKLSMSDKESSIGNKKTKVKMNKTEKKISQEKAVDSSKREQNAKAHINGTNLKEKSFTVENKIDELLKQEMNRMKKDLRSSDGSSSKEEREIKTVIKKQKTLKEETKDLLYEKLLKEAKNAIDMDRDKLTSLLCIKELGINKNKKESDLSDFSTSSYKDKNLEKKKKTEICNQTPEKCRNGSMYDWAVTPEKVYPDKSLFSDSEHSHASPFKRVKETNGTETTLGKSLVQNRMSELYKEEKNSLKSKSDRENSKILKQQEKKKSKLEKMSQSTDKKEESLYEKLLKEAKSMIDAKDQSLPKKKKKKLS